MININNIDDPRISHYKTLQNKSTQYLKERIFITEGINLTLQLLKSNTRVISIFATPDFYDKYHDIISSRNLPDNQLFQAEKSQMEGVVGFKLHSGIMAIAEQPAEVKLEQLESPIVVLNGIINSENVGSIIRNCAAFSVNSVIADKTTSSPYLRRAVRVSMGAILNMKVHFTNDLNNTLKILKNQFYKIISSEITDKAQSINDFEFPEKFCLIFGSEGYGISNEILSISDTQIFIPITGKVHSLNVASSSAIILSKYYEKVVLD